MGSTRMTRNGSKKKTSSSPRSSPSSSPSSSTTSLTATTNNPGVAAASISQTPSLSVPWFGHQTDSLWQQEAFNELLLLLSARTHSRKQRRHIHERIAGLLADCTGEELDALLLSSDLRVFIKLSTMRTMEVVRGRMGELSIRCKASLLHEFNMARRYKNIIHFNFWAQFVREIFHSTKGVDLTILKNAIDSSGSWKNLFNLVYEEFNIIGGKDLRDEVLQHIKREAAHVRRINTVFDPCGPGAQSSSSAASPSPRLHAKPRIKIISDLDDTVWCSGGKFPAGCDKTYPAHSFYPGIFALYKEVGIGAESGLAGLNSFPSPTHTLSPPLSPLSSLGRQASGAVSSNSNAPPPQRNGDRDVLMRYSSSRHQGEGNSSALTRVTCSANLEEHSVVTLDCDSSVSIAKAWKRLASKAGRPVYDMKVCLESNARGGVANHDATGVQDHTLVMLSARPGVKAAKGFFESMMYRKFIHLKEKGYFHTIPTLLPGSLIAGAKAMVMGLAGKVATCVNLDNRIVWKEVAHKKYKDMVKYMELYPEYDFIFFGDDGQGDVQVAINALKNPKLAVMGPGPRLSDVFIHKVLRTAESAALSETPDIHSPKSFPESLSMDKVFRLFSIRHEKRHKDQIHHYANTIDAALVMYERDYISLEGLYHVTLQSCMDLLRLLRRGVYQHKAWRKEYGKALINEYQKSVDQVNQILPNHMQLDDLPDLDSVGIEQEIKVGASSRSLVT